MGTFIWTGDGDDSFRLAWIRASSCDDYLARMVREQSLWGFSLPNKQLACAPLSSELGQEYLGAMAFAANYAWANRQVLSRLTREAFENIFRKSAGEMKMKLLFDVAHNISKLETLPVDGKMQRLCVHSKCATRALPPLHPLLPQRYQATGQPVLIPGDIGPCSFILVGTERAHHETFASCCHGVGREMSRTQAIKNAKSRNIAQEMKDRGVLVMAGSKATLGEEMFEAYKRVDEVVDVVHNADIACKIAKLKTIGCIKG